MPPLRCDAWLHFQRAPLARFLALVHVLRRGSSAHQPCVGELRSDGVPALSASGFRLRVAGFPAQPSADSSLPREPVLLIPSASAILVRRLIVLSRSLPDGELVRQSNAPAHLLPPSSAAALPQRDVLTVP